MTVLKVYVILTLVWTPVVLWIYQQDGTQVMPDPLMLLALALAWPALILMGLRDAIQKALRRCWR